MDWGDHRAFEGFDDVQEDERHLPDWDTVTTEQQSSYSDNTQRQPGGLSRWFARALLDWIAASPLARAVNQMSPSSEAAEPEETPVPPAPSRTSQYAGVILSASRWCRAHVLTPSLQPLLAVLRYKPPVGPVAVLLTLSRLRRRSILDDAAAFFPRSRAARSLDLDMGDREYALAGGVAAECAAACAEAVARLRDAEVEGRAARNETDGEAAATAYATALVEALQLSCPPRGARSPLVSKTGEALCRLQQLSGRARWPAASWPEGLRTKPRLGTAKPRLLSASEAVVGVRAVDALLRVLRERLLEVARELQQAERRATTAARRGGLRLSARRERLSRTSAHVEAQLWRIGEVQLALMARPSLHPQGGHEAWGEEARRWLAEACAVVGKVVGGAATLPWDAQLPAQGVRAATGAAGAANGTEPSESVLSAWRDAGWRGCPTGAELLAALALVEDLPRAQRASLERQLVLPTRAARQATSLPQSLAALALAYGAHRLLSPRWHSLKDQALFAGALGVDLLRQKVYTPLRTLVVDLLSRKSRLTEASVTEDAEQSLDNMLRDLTGGSTNRTEALSAASRLYEAGLRAGTIKGLLSGRMVRLLLIQAQLLKLQSLRAMATLDDLVDANRLNVSLFATLPALLLALLAWRAATAAGYAVRARGLRSTKDVHAEMGDVLLKMERALLLADARSPHHTQPAATAIAAAPAPPTVLRGAELGEVCVLLHSYLRMLDFSTPPLSSRAADAIHRELQELLWGQLSPARQQAMLRSVATRHARLLRGKVGAALDMVSAA